MAEIRNMTFLTIFQNHLLRNHKRYQAEFDFGDTVGQGQQTDLGRILNLGLVLELGPFQNGRKSEKCKSRYLPKSSPPKPLEVSSCILFWGYFGPRPTNWSWQNFEFWFSFGIRAVSKWPKSEIWYFSPSSKIISSETVRGIKLNFILGILWAKANKLILAEFWILV